MRGISAAAAFEALAEEEALVAIDIRSSADVKASGTPDLRSTKKPLKAVPFSKVAILFIGAHSSVGL